MARPLRVVAGIEWRGAVFRAYVVALVLKSSEKTQSTLFDFSLSHSPFGTMAFTGFNASTAELAAAPRTAPSEAGSLSNDPTLIEFAAYAKVPSPVARFGRGFGRR